VFELVEGALLPMRVLGALGFFESQSMARARIAAAT
jgi:hypothetical protein